MNKNQTLRDKLIGGCFSEATYCGGIRRFENLPLNTLEELIVNDFVDLDDCQNDSPSIRDLVAFGESITDSNHGIAYSGYVVDKSRSDYRVSIDGIRGLAKNTTENAKTIKKYNRSANERDTDIVNSDEDIMFDFWWD